MDANIHAKKPADRKGPPAHTIHCMRHARAGSTLYAPSTQLPSTLPECASSPEPIARANSTPPAELPPVPPATASARPSSTSSSPASKAPASSTSTPAPEPSASKPSAAEPPTSGSAKTPPRPHLPPRQPRALKITRNHTLEDRGTGALLQRLAKLPTANRHRLPRPTLRSRSRVRIHPKLPRQRPRPPTPRPRRHRHRRTRQQSQTPRPLRSPRTLPPPKTRRRRPQLLRHRSVSQSRHRALCVSATSAPSDARLTPQTPHPHHPRPQIHHKLHLFIRHQIPPKPMQKIPLHLLHPTPPNSAAASPTPAPTLPTPQSNETPQTAAAPAPPTPSPPPPASAEYASPLRPRRIDHIRIPSRHRANLIHIRTRINPGRHRSIRKPQRTSSQKRPAHRRPHHQQQRPPRQRILLALQSAADKYTAAPEQSAAALARSPHSTYAETHREISLHSHRIQCLRNILDQILHRLAPRAQPNKSFGNRIAAPSSPAAPPSSSRRRSSSPPSPASAFARNVSAAALSRSTKLSTGPKYLICRASNLMPRMPLQPRIHHTLNLRPRRQKLRNRLRIRTRLAPAAAAASQSTAAPATPPSAPAPRPSASAIGRSFPAAPHPAPPHAPAEFPVPGHRLCIRRHRKIRPQRQRPLPHRRRRRVVHRHQRPRLMSRLAQRRDVAHVHRRIARRLHPQQPRALQQRSLAPLHPTAPLHRPHLTPISAKYSCINIRAV